ncbi:hypothetical protein [Flavobacterium algicola]|uniref:hypothetical protein n=1 Tax=Flavobacterium algicola TaxID=556529 RepID=UPI001EFEABEC|nr:hypothetical protein [Flavobacterium algicola]MCG9793812.1 hypothetical protein [Flavobacterium algicola]
MKKAALIVLYALITNQMDAQFIKERSLNLSFGYGLTFPYEEEVDIINSGVYAQAEYVLTASKWIAFRPYAGVLFTKSNGTDINGNFTPYKATTNALLLGAKARLTFPIPYIAPYVESGIGASIGRFKSITPYSERDESGIIHHIPFSLGLSIGRNHNLDIAFTYYFQPLVQQIAGALAIGYTIPLRS